MDVLSWQCSPFHVNTPLAPEIERLKRATGMQESDRPELLVAKLRALLVRAVRDVERPLRYYGAVLSIPACAGYEPADLGSPSERERAFQTMVGVLAEASRTEEETLIVTCNRKHQETVRQHWPFLRDRRIDAYAGVTRRLIDE